MPRKRQHIYTGQAYAIELNTNTSLSTATSMYIRYKKPDETIGLLVATETASGSQILSAVMPGTTNDQPGQWELRSWVIFSGDANPVPGTPVKLIVEEL